MSDDERKNEHSKKSNLLAGTAKSVTFALVSAPTIVAKSVMKWFFNSPIKFFRPYAVSPWNVLNEMAQSEGKIFGIKYLRDLYTTDGFKVVTNNFWPLFLLNCFSGFVIFSTYSLSYKGLTHWIDDPSFKSKDVLNTKIAKTTSWAPLIAGGCSGAVVSLLLTPIHNIRSLVTPNDLLTNRHTGILNYSFFLLKKLFKEQKTFVDRTRLLFKRLPGALIRDSLCYSLFFGSFENLCIVTENFCRSDSLSTKNKDTITSHSKMNLFALKTKETFAPILFSGAVAGATYNLVYYPTQTYRRVVIDTLNTPHINHDSKITLKNLYSVIKIKGISPFYSGVKSQLIRVVTPSAIALFVYKMTTNETD